MKKEPTLSDFLVGVLLFSIATVTWGHVTVYIWAWHITPLFGVRSITFVEALGLRASVFAFLYRPDTKTEKSFNERTAEAILGAFITWGFAWLWYWLRD